MGTTLYMGYCMLWIFDFFFQWRRELIFARGVTIFFCVFMRGKQNRISTFYIYLSNLHNYKNDQNQMMGKLFQRDAMNFNY